MSLTKFLESVRARLDAPIPEQYKVSGSLNEGFVDLMAAAPKDLDKLLRIVEVQREALEQITAGNWTYPVDAAIKEVSEIAGEG